MRAKGGESISSPTRSITQPRCERHDHFGGGKRMPDATVQITQRRWARIAGAALVLICSVGILSNNLVVAGNAAATAHNIITHEPQFRVGIAGELIMLNGDVLLAAALYALLRSVDNNLALLGAFWRLGNAFILAVGIVVSLVALDLLRDTHYLTAFRIEQIQAEARQFLDIHGTAAEIGLVFFGIGAATHAYLLWKSRYIPRILSGLYLIMASEVVVSCFLILIVPALDAIIDPWFILPDFAVEFAVGLWLLIKGAKIILPAASDAGIASGRIATAPSA